MAEGGPRGTPSYGRVERVAVAALLAYAAGAAVLFNQWSFLVFFAVVYGAYLVLRHRAQNILLLAASYIFYAWWDWRFVGLLLASTVADFYIGFALGKAEGDRKKWLVRFSVVLNLAFLGVFKYFNFFRDTLASALATMHVHADLPTLDVVLPVGISFYTFMSLSYTIDVYRGETKPARSFIDYALFVAFFPHLVAGPIVRDTVLLPQLQRPRTVTARAVQSGALLVLIGLTRKFVADYLSEDVERAFAAPGQLGSLTVLVGVIAFSIQIYGDFAGYTDIARGISRMMGIELVRNFQHPYFARNLTIFWRRWHMSLSSWLRDYLYIPLGGNRGGQGMAYRNLMLTMLLGGLWHGASWNFVVWGGLHGLGLCVHKLFSRGARPDAPRRPGLAGSVAALGAWALTMAWVALAWVFFRAATFRQAVGVIAAVLQFHRGVEGAPVRHLLLAVSVMLVIDVPQARADDELAWTKWPWPVRGVVFAAAVVTMLLVRTSRDVPFIYFQF